MQRNRAFERMRERLTVKQLLAFDKEVNEGVAKTCHLTPNLMFSLQQN